MHREFKKSTTKDMTGRCSNDSERYSNSDVQDNTAERLNIHEFMGCVEMRKTDKWKSKSKNEKRNKTVITGNHWDLMYRLEDMPVEARWSYFAGSTSPDLFLTSTDLPI